MDQPSPHWNETVVSSAKELDAEIRRVRDVAGTNAPSIAWRGMGRADWTLRSSLDRRLLRIAAVADYNQKLVYERAMLEEFRERALPFASAIEAPYLASLSGHQVWNALALGRHFGLPTRATDWTSSSAVARWFVCIENPSEDGAIWWFNNRQLENVLHGHWQSWEVPLRDDGSGERAIEQIAFGSVPANWATKIHYPLPFARMEVQQGFMLVSARSGLDHDRAIDWVASHGEVERGRIRIAGAAKPEVLNELKDLGVTAHSLLYPGMDIVAADIVRQVE